MRVLTVRCAISYTGRGQTELAEAVRLILVKRDGSVAVHSDDGISPRNYMKAPCLISIVPLEDGTERWEVTSRKERLDIHILEVLSDSEHPLEEAEPGLVRSWTEAHLQAWIAGHVEEVFGQGWVFIAREFRLPGAGAVDLLVQHPDGTYVAVEVKRTAHLGAVDQVSRYVEAMRKQPEFATAAGMVVAPDVRPRARDLAAARGIGFLEIPLHLYRA